MKKIGIAVVALLLVIGLVIWSPWTSNKKHITAVFQDAAGLFVGNDVGVLGVPVGKVTSITPNGADVNVVIEVPNSVDVPANSFAKIVARSVATDRYVEIQPYISGAKMQDGGTIPVSNTASPVDFDAVLKSLDVLSTGLSNSPEAKQAVQRLVDSAYTALNGKGPLLNQTITSLGGSTKILADQRQNIVDLITSLDDVVKVVNKNQGTANTFIKQVSQASVLLASQKQSFHAALVALNTVVAQLAQFDHDNRALITSNLTDATTLMKTVLSRQNEVSEILETFPAALRNLHDAVSGGRLRVRLEPTTLLPLGSLLQKLCTGALDPVCTLIDGTSGLTTLFPGL
ncbi:ABC transporter substrate-binding protein [Nocardioides baekrokdamisoli]|uniref:ABC transporter substrate-binding protein n=1 Tax=Nocardioides baekrokdamisoli TaxID=1804624 RepID=A0A3G9IIW2_9ACTN|nr:MCE family protein [Nocardioides baekrokdamisoli]BBH15995.1 ABC transporter substrate-binding protein [Nocardioides baekrokdamisoli]